MVELTETERLQKIALIIEAKGDSKDSIMAHINEQDIKKIYDLTKKSEFSSSSWIFSKTEAKQNEVL